MEDSGWVYITGVTTKRGGIRAYARGFNGPVLKVRQTQGSKKDTWYEVRGNEEVRYQTEQEALEHAT